MSDEERRALERRALEGDAAARAALDRMNARDGTEPAAVEGRRLLARVGAGALARPRLVLAACLGYPPARAALGPDAPPEPAGSLAPSRIVELGGHEAIVRESLGLARARLHLAGPDEDAASAGIRAVETWLARPTEETRQACHRAAAEIERRPASRPIVPWDHGDAGYGQLPAQITPANEGLTAALAASWLAAATTTAMALERHPGESAPLRVQRRALLAWALADTRPLAFLDGRSGPATVEESLRPGADLAGADLAGLWLWDVALAGANLRGARLAGADLEGADLAGADLREADLSGARLVGANLARARLAGARLAAADLSDTSLAGAELERVDLAGARLRAANLASARLEGACLERAHLFAVRLDGADLRGANLRMADLTGALSSGSVDLAGSDLTGARLAGATLPQARLGNARLAQAWLVGADLREADLAGADLTGANLDGARLPGSEPDPVPAPPGPPRRLVDRPPPRVSGFEIQGRPGPAPEAKEDGSLGARLRRAFRGILGD